MRGWFRWRRCEFHRQPVFQPKKKTKKKLLPSTSRETFISKIAKFIFRQRLLLTDTIQRRQAKQSIPEGKWKDRTISKTVDGCAFGVVISIWYLLGIGLRKLWKSIVTHKKTGQKAKRRGPISTMASIFSKRMINSSWASNILLQLSILSGATLYYSKSFDLSLLKPAIAWRSACLVAVGLLAVVLFLYSFPLSCRNQ